LANLVLGFFNNKRKEETDWNSLFHNCVLGGMRLDTGRNLVHHFSGGRGNLTADWRCYKKSNVLLNKIICRHY